MFVNAKTYFSYKKVLGPEPRVSLGCQMHCLAGVLQVFRRTVLHHFTDFLRVFDLNMYHY
jgi:hypothetical protein